MRPEWDYKLSELVGGSEDPDAPIIAGQIEASVKAIEAENRKFREALLFVATRVVAPIDRSLHNGRELLQATMKARTVLTEAGVEI